MTTMLVWVLMSVSIQYSGFVSYSPQMADLASCERLQKANMNLQEFKRFETQCVQIRVPVTK